VYQERKLDAVGDASFLEDPCEVGLDGRQGQKQGGGDLGVRAALGHEVGDLPLAFA
jgi:hypothetical protein